MGCVLCLLLRVRVVHGPHRHPVRPRASLAVDRRRDVHRVHRPSVADAAAHVARLVDLHHRGDALRLRPRRGPASSTRPIQVTPQADIDRIIGLGHVPTVWLQQHFLEAQPRWWDAAASIIYASALHPAVRRRRHLVRDEPQGVGLVREPLPRALLPRLRDVRPHPDGATVVRQPDRRDRPRGALDGPRLARSSTCTRRRR